MVTWSFVGSLLQNLGQSNQQFFIESSQFSTFVILKSSKCKVYMLHNVPLESFWQGM